MHRNLQTLRGRYTVSTRVCLVIIHALVAIWETHFENLLDDTDQNTLAYFAVTTLDRVLGSAEMFVFWRSARFCDRLITQCRLVRSWTVSSNVFQLINSLIAKLWDRPDPRIAKIWARPSSCIDELWSPEPPRRRYNQSSRYPESGIMIIDEATFVPRQDVLAGIAELIPTYFLSVMANDGIHYMLFP